MEGICCPPELFYYFLFAYEAWEVMVVKKIQSQPSIKMGVGFWFGLVGFVFNSIALLEWYLCRSSCLTQTSTSVVPQLESKKCMCVSLMDTGILGTDSRCIQNLFFSAFIFLSIGLWVWINRNIGMKIVQPPLSVLHAQSPSGVSFSLHVVMIALIGGKNTHFMLRHLWKKIHIVSAPPKSQNSSDFKEE